MNTEQRIKGMQVQVKLLSLQPGPTVDAEEMVTENMETPGEIPLDENVISAKVSPSFILRKEVSGDASYLLNLKVMGSLMQ